MPQFNQFRFIFTFKCRQRQCTERRRQKKRHLQGAGVSKRLPHKTVRQVSGPPGQIQTVSPSQSYNSRALSQIKTVSL